MSVRTAALTSASTIQWSDGSPFNGYAWVYLQPPTSGGSSWPAVSLGGTVVRREVPFVFPIQIVDGEYSSDSKLYYTADITPDNTRYNARFTDSNRQLVDGGTTVLFAVTSDPHTLNPPTLTLPTTPVTPSIVPD